MLCSLTTGVLSPVWEKKVLKVFIVCLLAMNHNCLESDFIYCEFFVPYQRDYLNYMPFRRHLAIFQPSHSSDVL